MDSPSTDFANEPANDILPIISPLSAGSSASLRDGNDILPIIPPLSAGSSASLHDGNAPPLESADLDASLSTESNVPTGNLPLSAGGSSASLLDGNTSSLAVVHDASLVNSTPHFANYDISPRGQVAQADLRQQPSNASM
jgi:hypothetical protein